MASIQAERKNHTDRDARTATTLNPAAALDMLDPFAKFSAGLFDSWFAMGSELLHFSQLRCERNFEAATTAARLTSLAEARDWHAAYITATAQDYANEGRRLAELGQEKLSSYRPPISGTAQDATQAAGQAGFPQSAAPDPAREKQNGHAERFDGGRERRKFPRISIDSPLTVERLSGTHDNAPAQLLNLSEGGAAIKVKIAVKNGEEIGMRPQGDDPVFGRVVQFQDGVLRMKFRSDEDTRTRVAKTLSSYVA